MKVVVFGCQQIAVDFIDYLTTLKDVKIPFVVTYELPLDKSYGYESVLEKASKKGLEVITYTGLPLIDKLRKVQPDIIFSLYYRKILPKELLDISRLGCVNIHPSKLPYYRGPTPTAWAIRNGEKKCGISIHYMDEGIDTGDILVQKEYDILDDETGFELYTRIMVLGVELLKENFHKIINCELKPFKQKGIGSYYGKLDGKYIIDWRQKLEVIRNIIRVHAKPYNPAETILLNRYVLINKARVLRDEGYRMQGVGVIIDILDGDKLVVSCADGCLVLEDYEIVPYLTEREKPIYLRIGNKFGG